MPEKVEGKCIKMIFMVFDENSLKAPTNLGSKKSTGGGLLAETVKCFPNPTKNKQQKIVRHTSLTLMKYSDQSSD